MGYFEIKDIAMNKIKKYWLFPRLPQLVLAVGVVTFLLIGVFLFFSAAVPNCDNVSTACMLDGNAIEQQIEEQDSQETVADTGHCSGPGSTGWTGASCVPAAPTPTPTIEPECMPWPRCLGYTFP